MRAHPLHPGARGDAHDVLAIGCGPFNLGLAALASTVPDIDLLVLDAEPELRWHRGLMFDDATLQVSFLADLVTLVAPTHPLSFLAYLRDVDRMYPFYVRERFHLTRREYEDYLRWAARKLAAIRFRHRVEAVRWDERERAFAADVTAPDGARHTTLARHLVVGIGTEPALPEALRGLSDARCFHAGAYLDRSSVLADARHVTIVGSGQSGAEVAVDLLERNLAGGPAVSWLTRTPAFAPLDYTKLVLEMTTPAYVRYFHGLPEETRDALVREQWQHYKGISTDTLDRIHDLLYRREVHAALAPVELRAGVAVESAVEERGRVVLRCRHRDTGAVFEHATDLVVAATGYRHRRPTFLEPVDPYLRKDAQGRLVVGIDHAVAATAPLGGSIFVANADLHSHGVAAPDLGLCAYRNATILNAVAGREVYPVPRRTAFTRFERPPLPSASDTTDRAHAPCERPFDARPA